MRWRVTFNKSPSANSLKRHIALNNWAFKIHDPKLKYNDTSLCDFNHSRHLQKLSKLSVFKRTHSKQMMGAILIAWSVVRIMASQTVRATTHIPIDNRTNKIPRGWTKTTWRGRGLYSCSNLWRQSIALRHPPRWVFFNSITQQLVLHFLWRWRPHALFNTERAPYRPWVVWAL